MYDSPWLNLTLYPDEADYPRARRRSASTWHNLQTSVRATDAPWELPGAARRARGPARLPLARVASAAPTSS